jgi:hypothetical protein
MPELNDYIKQIENEMITDGTIEKLIRDRFTKEFEKALDDEFKWGDVREAIRDRIKSVMVPAIEHADMNDYIVKLDTVLCEVIKQTAVPENSVLLENFKDLMTESDIKEIDVSKILDKYGDFVAESIDTDGRDIDYETGDGPHYEDAEVSLEIEYDERESWSCFDYANIRLTTKDDSSGDHEDLGRTIRIMRYKKNSKDKWMISINNENGEDSIRSIRYMSNFDIFLLKLQRAGTKITLDIEEETLDVTPVNEPELTYK